MSRYSRPPRLAMRPSVVKSSGWGGGRGPRPARLEERGQPELVEQPVEAGRGQPEGPEVLGGRVEVEDHLVGVVDVGGAAEPDVRGDAALVGQVREVVGGPADGVGDLLADGGLAGAAGGGGAPPPPVGEVPADLLL